MRKEVTPERLQDFMKVLASGVTQPARVFLVGGASAVLLGFRDSTIDVDLKFTPEHDEILKQLPAIKESLQINIELAAPDDFIPELPAWQERSRFIRQEGRLTFLHYDFYAQALAKIERGHEMDLLDVEKMIDTQLVKPDRLLELFEEIESQIYKYPALNSASFRRAVELAVHHGGEALPSATQANEN